VSESRHTVYYHEDGRSALVEFAHGMTDYRTVGRITYCPGHPGSFFCFEKVHGDCDFAVLAEDMLVILNRLTGNDKFPNRDTSIEDTQVIPVVRP
jgi:hypothetical protein